MAQTKSKSTRSSTKRSSTKATTAKSSSRSKPRGKKRTVSHNPFAPEAKVGVYHAYEVGPQRDMQRAPLGKPLTTVTAKKDGTVEFNVKDDGQYALAAENKQGGWDYQIVSVKK